MLSINHQSTSANYQTKQHSINFKSRLVPTEYLETGFDEAIRKGFGGNEFLKGIKAILNDGKNDIIKIDKTPGSHIFRGRAAKHDIFVNGQKVVDAESNLGLIYDGSQCENAIKEFAQDYKKMEETPADNLRESERLICIAAQKGNMDEMLSWNIIHELRKVKNHLGEEITKELKEIKKQIFNN